MKLILLFGALSIALIGSRVLSPQCQAADSTNAFPRPTNIAEVRSLVAMDDAGESMLKQNGFVVLDNIGVSNLCDAYSHHGSHPHLYVTSDAMLALWSALHRRVQEDMEQNVLAPKLSAAVSQLAASNIKMMDGANDPFTKSSLRRNAVCLLTAVHLLDATVNAPADLKAEAAAEARRIEEHTVSESYPGDDYTQYTVRGFYADTPELSRYFRAAMFLSRHFWPTTVTPGAVGEDGLRDAVAMAAVLRANPGARASIVGINSTRSALFGSPNAVSVEQIIAAEDKLIGSKWTLNQAITPGAMTVLRRELASSKYPKALVHTRKTAPNQDFPALIVSLLPDIALPDGVAFQTTVNPAISGRSLPSGLEVTAALGFEQSRRALAAGPDGSAIVGASDAASPHYLASESGAGLWYRALAALAKSDPRAPAFMQSPAWEAKETSTALSSWAQLRHDAILEASQTYAQTMGIDEAQPALVEANPAVFTALAALADNLRVMILQPDAMSSDSSKNLLEFASECRAFSDMATAELAGKVTEKQSNRASEFGAWLEQFNIKTSPMIADVATGQFGEVMHVADGAFRPIVVIPDPKRPVAYIGWTQSYYEIVRHDGRRLTDSAWATMAAATDAAVQRPEWTSQFVAPQNGPVWAAREGLRHAEQLFLDGKDADALTALRAVVDANRNTDVSTDAQFRIGKYYLDRKDAGNAYQEMLKCRSLPGGEAYTEAQYFVSRLFDARTRKNAAFIRHNEKTNQAASALIDRVAALPTGDPKRPALELQLVKLMCAPTDPGEGLSQAIFDRAASACRGPATHELLAYIAVMTAVTGFSDTPSSVPEPWDDSDNSGDAEFDNREKRNRQLPALAKTFRSPALKAAIFAYTLESHVFEGATAMPEDQVIAALKPYLPGVVFQSKTDPVMALYRSVADFQERSMIDPFLQFKFGVSQYREERVHALWTTGKLERAVEIQRTLLLPGEGNDEDGINDDPASELAKYPEFNHEPLRLKVMADAVKEDSPLIAAKMYADIYRLYPKSKLAPMGLWMAQSIYGRINNQKEAARLLGILLKSFAATPPALAARAEDLYHSGDPAGALRLIGRLPEESLQDRLPMEFSDTVLTVTNDAKRDVALRPLLARYARTIGAGAPPRDLADDYAISTIRAYIKQKPGEAYDVINDLVDAVPQAVQQVVQPLLADAPDTPGIRELRQKFQPRGTAARMPEFPEGLDALVPIINGDPGAGFDDAVLKLRACLGSPQSDIAFEYHKNVRDVVERARYVIAKYPQTRVASLAAQIAARTMLEASEPENALEMLQDERSISSASDPALRNGARLKLRATKEIAAKSGVTWNPLWTFDMNADMALSDEFGSTIATPVEAGSTLALPYFHRADDSGLIGLDTATGAVRWKVRLGVVTGLVATTSGNIFAAAGEELTALDPINGKAFFKLPLPKPRNPEYSPQARNVTLLASTGNVVVATVSASSVMGFDASTGKLLWTKPWMACNGSSQASRPPAIIGNTVFLTNDKSVVYALDTATGNELWKMSFAQPVDDNTFQTTEWQPVGNNPVALDSAHVLVYVNRDLEVLDVATGKVTATHSHPKHATINDALFGGSSGYTLEWTEQEDAMLWPTTGQDVDILSMPRHNGDQVAAYDGPHMYFMGENMAYAVDLATGAQLGWSPVETCLLDWTTIGKDEVYFSGIEGKVTALPRFKQIQNASAAL